MTQYDVLVRGGTVVRQRGSGTADIAIAGERIAAIGPDLEGTATEEIDARGLWVFPGAVDAHVHFNEPGRAEWEGFATGTAALAAGGTTTFCDMPLNASPPTLDGASFDLKRQAAEGQARVDFGLWGGLVPGNLEKLGELAERGVVGLKAFMTSSGIDDFPMADDTTLRRGMARAAELELLVAVHAEDDATISDLTARFREREGFSSIVNFLASRPVEAEVRAIRQAIAIATSTGCRLHIVHVSSREGIDWVAQARGRYVDVSCETCPHYLILTADDVERLGAVAKCAPPLRSNIDMGQMWSALAGGMVPMVASDHSPAPPGMKTGADFFAIWGGISGCQSTRQLLLAREGLDLQLIAALTSMNVARRFRLKGKGDITSGFDADLWIVDLDHEDVVRSKDLLYRNPFSPHEGQPIRGRTVRTIVRGKTVFAEGQVQPGSAGSLVTPTV
ncbi:MAG TPA: allantoinase AllB [Ktedonobacterales bacterium]